MNPDQEFAALLAVVRRINHHSVDDVVAYVHSTKWGKRITRERISEAYERSQK